MVDYMGAIKRPISDIKTLVIGIIIGLIPVVNILVSGFSLKAAQKTLNNDNSLPGWNVSEIGDLIVKSIMVLVIGLIYNLPAIIVLVITGVTAVFAIMAGADPITTILGGGLFLIIGLILAIVGGILSSMGIMFYAAEGRFGSAFKFGAILRKVLTVKYLISLIVIAVWMIVLALVMGVLSIIPIIGSFVGTGIMTYLGGVTSYTILAQTFNETP